jgi:hypothetical protein
VNSEPKNLCGFAPLRENHEGTILESLGNGGPVERPLGEHYQFVNTRRKSLVIADLGELDENWHNI